jgi:hypothetical protein
MSYSVHSRTDAMKPQPTRTRVQSHPTSVMLSTESELSAKMVVTACCLSGALKDAQRQSLVQQLGIRLAISGVAAA